MIELRTTTGLTQQLLADLLQIPRSTYSLGEMGVRDYPVEGLQKLVLLWSHVPPSAEAADLPLLADILSSEEQLAASKMAMFQEECRIKAANKQLELDKMTNKYNQSLRLLQMLGAFGAQLPRDSANEATHSWIDGATSFAKLKLMDNSLAKQQLLALEIRQLRTI